MIYRPWTKGRHYVYSRIHKIITDMVGGDLPCLIFLIYVVTVKVFSLPISSSIPYFSPIWGKFLMLKTFKLIAFNLNVFYFYIIKF